MGEGIRGIARAFYEGAGEEEKKQAIEFFRKLDLNGDRKVSLGEFKKGVESNELADVKVFNELDLNRDGLLDFDDVLVLFYNNNKNKIVILRCAGCRVLVYGPRFSCFQCLFNSADRRYALCCACYGGGKFQHQHPLSSSMSTVEVLQEQHLLVKLSQIMSEDPKSLTQKDMDELRKIAKSHSGAASLEVDKIIDDLFQSMGNRDGGVNIQKLSTEQESAVDAFLKSTPDSDPTTNFMKEKFRSIHDPTAPTLVVAPSVTVQPPSHCWKQEDPSTNAVVTSPTDCPDQEDSSTNAIVSPPCQCADPEDSYNKRIVRSSSVMKVATTTLKIVEMAVTVASISSACTIL